MIVNVPAAPMRRMIPMPASPRKHPLTRPLLWALLVKVALLMLLYGLFFSPRHRATQDPATAASAILGPGDEGAPRHD